MAQSNRSFERSSNALAATGRRRSLVEIAAFGLAFWFTAAIVFGLFN